MNQSQQLKHKKYISAIIYSRTGTKELIEFLNQIEAILTDNFENYEIIIVNNQIGSNLKSELQGHTIAGLNGDLSIINLAWQHNIEDAMRAGIDLSMGDLVFEFDSVYFDYDPQIILEAYNECLKGYEMVSVSPSKINNVFSFVFYKMLKIFSNDLVISTETFRLVTRKMINLSSHTKEVFRYRKANYHYTGLKSISLKYSSNNKINPLKETSFITRTQLAVNILIYYSSIGTRISLFLAVFFFFVSIIVAFYVVIIFLTNHDNIQEGWASIMLFLSLSFCGLFGILALISKYLEVLLKDTKGLRPYSFSTIEKMSKNIK